MWANAQRDGRPATFIAHKITTSTNSVPGVRTSPPLKIREFLRCGHALAADAAASCQVEADVAEAFDCCEAGCRDDGCHDDACVINDASVEHCWGRDEQH